MYKIRYYDLGHSVLGARSFSTQIEAIRELEKNGFNFDFNVNIYKRYVGTLYQEASIEEQ